MIVCREDNVINEYVLYYDAILTLILLYNLLNGGFEKFVKRVAVKHCT